MDNIDEFFQGSHYNIIRILLSISGIWPFHTTGKCCAIYIGLALILGSGLTFEVLGTIEVWHNSFELIDCMPLLLLAIVTLTKLCCAVYTLPKIKVLLIKIHQYYLSSKSDEEAKIYHSHVIYGRNLGYTCVGILLSHNAIFIITTLLIKLIHVESAKNDTSLSKVQGAQAGLPYRVNYIVDVDTYYIPIFIHTTTCDVSYIILITTFNVLYLTLVEYCCGLFAALRYRLENAFELDDNADDLVMTSTKNKSHSNIVYSIRRHIEAMQFVTIMESIYSLPLFVDMGATILVLSVLLYQVVTNTDNINHILKHISYLNGLLINIFFENWQGQKIIDSSESIYESAYNAKWYKMPIATQKLLMMIMIKSKKPLEISIGKFFVMSYVTFNAVLRTSSSYFMLLRSL